MGLLVWDPQIYSFAILALHCTKFVYDVYVGLFTKAKQRPKQLVSWLHQSSINGKLVSFLAWAEEGHWGGKKESFLSRKLVLFQNLVTSGWPGILSDI